MGQTKEDRDAWARRKGYKGISHYAQVSDLLGGRRNFGGKRQRAMEGSIDVLDIGPVFQEGHSVMDLDYMLDIKWAMEVLAEIGYDNRGNIVYGRPNSSGKRMARVIEGLYYEGKTLEKIGKEMGITREGVRQIKIRGIQCLRRILTK